ncbi:MAG: O-antigen ligase family protein [Armatimonadetes bacterium]|nr:O-antigen ligase family protein [Armatimonadota bacterium]
MVSVVGLLGALVLAPIIGGGFGELTNAILQILVFGAIAVYLLFPGRDRGGWLRAPGMIPMAIFFLAVLISTFFTEALYPSLTQILFISACLGAYMLSASLSRDPKVAAILVSGAVLSALIICVDGVRDYAISTGGGRLFWESLVSSGDHWRLFGTFVNPGFFAGYLVIAIPVTLGVYLVARRTVLAILVGLAFALETMALMLTGTKFAIVAGVAALVVFFVFAVGTRSLRRSRFTRLIIIALVLLPLLIVCSGPVRSRIVAAESGGTQVHSTTFRVYTWQGTLEMVRNNPWKGVGPGAFAIAYPRYTLAGPTSYAHQSYLQIAAESGVPAAIAFLLVLLAIAGRSAVGMVSGDTSDRTPKSSEVSASHANTMTWSDVVPFSGWRILNCAMFAAIAGSIIRNAVDSDWYLIGISLPFWVLAGVLVSQSGATRGPIVQKHWMKTGLLVVCAVGILLSISFGLGDWFAPDESQFVESGSLSEARQSYAQAAAVSPLNPLYHRELAKYLMANGEPEEAIRQADTAIRLAPTEAPNYYVRGMISLSNRDIPSAIRFFHRSLKFNPNSTRTLYQLALTYRDEDNTKEYESTLRSLLAIEESDYEQVKGAPEMVDTTFARAHVYFADKYMARKRYAMAADEFRDAIDRLENWRSHEQYLEVALYAGMLTKEEERGLLELLRDSYFGLAQASSAMGKNAEAAEAREKGEKVKTERE